MGNLIRMDLYRMRKAKSFWVYVIMAFGLAAVMTPLARLLVVVSGMFSTDTTPFPETVKLSAILADPFPVLNSMLAMLSICAFFHADMENGYIKNIAGQMPRKGYTILSKFIASIPHNLLFMLVGVLGTLLGTIFVQRIVVDDGILNGILSFLLKLLLMQAICSILLLVTGSFRNKSLGMVLAVLLGLGLLSLVYMGIDTGLDKLIPGKSFAIANYMPDQLLAKLNPGTAEALAVSAVTLVIFLPLSIRVFDHRDVK